MVKRKHGLYRQYLPSRSLLAGLVTRAGSSRNLISQKTPLRYRGSAQWILLSNLWRMDLGTTRSPICGIYRWENSPGRRTTALVMSTTSRCGWSRAETVRRRRRRRCSVQQSAEFPGMPTYVSQYVLKVCGRCDLACDHCYVYEHVDQSWRRKPKVMAPETVAQAARRISEHAHRHRLARVSVVLHGGEPLLLGHERLRSLLFTLRSVIDPVTRLGLTVHTNGVLLDERLCELFSAYGVRVGVSLDGDRAANDRHRRFADGRSSYPQVLRALALLRRPESRHLYAGILCTVDVANDPVAVYEAVVAQAPPRLDLLLPHANWDNPPRRQPGSHAPYAAWLGQVHDRWVTDGRPVPIRFFD